MQYGGGGVCGVDVDPMEYDKGPVERVDAYHVVESSDSAGLQNLSLIELGPGTEQWQREPKAEPADTGPWTWAQVVHGAIGTDGRRAAAGAATLVHLVVAVAA